MPFLTAACKKSTRARVKQTAHAFRAMPAPSPTRTRTAKTVDTGSSASSAFLDEDHPTGPFVHADSRVLVCGTFPPVKKSINFYYPNSNNDMWRVLGEVFYHDRDHFFTIVVEAKSGRGRRSGKLRAMHSLNEAQIRSFALSESVGFFDICKRIRRHRGNSSDDNIEALERTDVLLDVLAHTPRCEAIITTGTLALTMLLDTLHNYGSFTSATGEVVEAVSRNRLGKSKYNIPPVGGKLLWTPSPTAYFRSSLWIYRAPSTSRALPINVEDKIAHYRAMFTTHLNLDDSVNV